jgi:hypothetical protein
LVLTWFTDAEVCFSISIIPDDKLNLKWRISPLFTIKLHKKKILGYASILEEIKNTSFFVRLLVGKIRTNGINSVQYLVESVTDLQIIVDHFDKYPLITAKVSDYLIFK